MRESALKSRQRSVKHNSSMKNAAGRSVMYVTPHESAESVRVVQTQSLDLKIACKVPDSVTEAEIL